MPRVGQAVSRGTRILVRKWKQACCARSADVRAHGWIAFAGLAAGVAGCLDQTPCPSPVTEKFAEVRAPADPPCRGSGSPYERGAFSTRLVALARCDHAAPMPARIFVPDHAGTFAVVVLIHGFNLPNICYGEIADHLASHGFVVVLPQIYEPGLVPLTGNPTAIEEARRVARLLAWLRAHLGEAAGVKARTDLLGLSGHSRGGKVAWMVLLEDPAAAAAIAGIDPVDGTGGPLGEQPRVIQGSFGLQIPSLVIGTGLAGSCAPAGDNHVQFYAASAPPAWHIVALDQGHDDMMDEGCAILGSLVCATGPDRPGMRRLTAGLLVAFFRATLQGDADALAWLTDVAAAPVAVSVEAR